jgi:hypothetical protein
MYGMTLFCLSKKCGLPAKIYFFSWFGDFFLPFFVFYTNLRDKGRGGDVFLLR